MSYNIMSVLLVTCMFPNETLARKVAEEVVETGLAACCQVGAPVRSFYRWRWDVEQADEVPLTCKTTEAAWPGVAALLKARHPYDLPEIIAVPITHGLPAYLEWVRENSAFPEADDCDANSG